MSEPYALKITEDIQDFQAVEGLQRIVWPGSETEIVPSHVMRSAVQHGGLLIGAYDDQRLVGFVFGFPGFYDTTDGPRLEHYSHLLAVHPDYRSHGLGFKLKRAQWQMVRHQGIDRIVWTYDPLLSRNAWLNITRLGAVCSTYLIDFYGSMQDELNAGLPTDRFEVDWWVNSRRVNRRLSRRPRPPLELAHFLKAGVQVVNPAEMDSDGWAQPSQVASAVKEPQAILLVEIPADYPGLKAVTPGLALEWRLHTRRIFETLFDQGYLVTDFIHQVEAIQRSFYVLSHGEATL